jgi:hypothetical protein
MSDQQISAEPELAEVPPKKGLTITLPSFNFTTMNPDAFFTFLVAGITALMPVLVQLDPGAAAWAVSAGDFCNTLSKDLAILGAALHLDGK